MGMKTSKLKRRLRKKFYLGEFRELGFEIFVEFKSNFSEQEFDKFSDEFIDLMENNKLLFGGGGKNESWEGFIASAKKFASPTQIDKDKVKGWLENRPEIKNYRVGEFLDAWKDSRWNN